MDRRLRELERLAEAGDLGARVAWRAQFVRIVRDPRRDPRPWDIVSELPFDPQVRFPGGPIPEHCFTRPWGRRRRPAGPVRDVKWANSEHLGFNMQGPLRWPTSVTWEEVSRIELDPRGTVIASVGDSNTMTILGWRRWAKHGHVIRVAEERDLFTPFDWKAWCERARLEACRTEALG